MTDREFFEKLAEKCEEGKRLSEFGLGHAGAPIRREIVQFVMIEQQEQWGVQRARIESRRMLYKAAAVGLYGIAGMMALGTAVSLLQGDWQWMIIRLLAAYVAVSVATSCHGITYSIRP